MTTYTRTVEPWGDEIATDDKLNSVARGILGGAKMTSSQSGIGTADLIDDLEFEFDPAESGRRIKICGLLHVQGTASNVGFVLEIKQGSTVLQRIKDRFDEANQDQLVSFEFPIEGFTAGTNTISPYIEVDGVATVQVTASSSQPCNLWAEDAGPVS